MKKIVVIVLSVVFLGLYFLYDKAEIFSKDAVMEIKLLSQEEIDASASTFRCSATLRSRATGISGSRSRDIWLRGF